MKKRNLFTHAFLILGLLFSLSCEKDDETANAVPSVESSTTEQNAEITYTTAEISGNAEANGGSSITARGVCWSETPNPSINDSKTVESTNSFTSVVDSLTPNTTYYFKIYATNQSGTGYGNQLQLSTSSLDNTMWDFYIEYDSITSWHADVNFYDDGTTKYDEPSSPGAYTTYGTWTLNGNTLYYDMDATDTTDAFYQFTGTLSGNTMSGTWTWQGQPDKPWNAVEY